MRDLSISKLIQMQEQLWEKNKDYWKPILPEYGRNHILWMIEEIGECISIIKKKGDSAIMNDPVVRAAFVEEMGDVLMYYAEIMRRYQISADELTGRVLLKHKKNMERDFKKEYSSLYQDDN